MGSPARYALSTLMVALVMASSLAGSLVSASDGKARSIWEQLGRYVRVVPQDLSTAPPNGQPVALNPAETKAVLGALEVETRGVRRFGRKTTEGWRLSVFDEKELDVLGKAVPLGLQEAGPHEDLVFLLTGDHDAGVRGVFRNHDLDTGRVFYRGGRLNVIFGKVHAEYDKSEAGALAPSALGSRQPRKDQAWWIVKIPGLEYHEQGGDGRRDWVEIDPRAVLNHLGWTREQVRHQGFVSESGPDRAQEDSRLAKPPGGAQGQATGAAAVGAGVKGSTAGAASPRVSRPVPSKGGTAPGGLILEERLELLKRLREKGLISEQVYDARVKGTLDRFLK